MQPSIAHSLIHQSRGTRSHSPGNNQYPRHHGNRCPYELRICNKCDWHTVQDEEHVILDCPSQDLAELLTQYQHIFSYVQDGSTTRLNDLINQTDALGVATYVAECLKCCD